MEWNTLNKRKALKREIEEEKKETGDDADFAEKDEELKTLSFEEMQKLQNEAKIKAVQNDGPKLGNFGLGVQP